LRTRGKLGDLSIFQSKDDPELQDEGVEMTIEDEALVLRRPAKLVRTGWAEAARKIAEACDDTLVMGEFANASDTELVW
jgi:antitoxin MazE